MKPRRLQQAIAGLAIVLVIAVTLLVGVFLTTAETPSAAQRPTSTPFRIPTLEPTASSTLSPVTIVPIPSSTRDTGTPTPTRVPPASPAPSATSTHDPAPLSPTSCMPPSDWVPYTVQPGENLFRIGLRYGLTVAQMMQANCLSSNEVVTGQVIYVPPIPPRATNSPSPTSDHATEVPSTEPVNTVADTLAVTLTPMPGPTSTQTATDGACTYSGSIITAPSVGAVLRGMAAFYGTATYPDFSFYKLEIRREGSSEGYVTFFTGYTEVFGGILAELDSTLWANGEYWIRLVVVNTTGNYPERCAILYTISN